MVRTETRARSRARPIGAPEVKLPAAGPRVSNNLVFKDHTGRSALMSWGSMGQDSRLAPLASWVFYMVHPDVPTDFDGAAFEIGLEDGNSLLRGGRFRYEFFFLPGATAEECHAHYLGEMEARGTIWRQIRKVKRAMARKKQENSQQMKGEEEEEDDDDNSASEGEEDNDGVTASANQLPGLVWPKRDEDCYFIGYRGWFFLYPDADVNCKGTAGNSRDVCLVTFDPISDQDGEASTFNPMEHPVHSKQMKARDEEYFDAGLFGWMEMRKNSSWEQKASEATENAMKLGWESW